MTLRAVAASGGASGITIGSTTITGGATTEVLYNLGGVVQSTSKLIINATAGQGPSIVAGTATTDVAALSITRTNNNAAVATGVKWTFTDTTSAAGFLPFQILGGAAGTTNLLRVSKEGNVRVGNGTAALPAYTFDAAANYGIYTSTGDSVDIAHSSGREFAFGNGVYIGLTTASKGSLFLGTSAKVAIHGTAPTLASGGCTNAAMVANNGTASFTAGVGTGCSGSQPLVFTLPAATRGWNCYARNETNAATSVAAQSSGVSTTSVTITNYSRTLGTAAAWTDADVITVSCLGG